LRDQVGLNLGLRNALAQLELDISNAGGGYFQTINITSWPVGVTILNNVVATGSSCYTSSSGTYGSSCFDQINIITAANSATYPPVNLTDSTGGTGSSNCSKTTNGLAYTQKALGFTLAQTAAEFIKGDQILLVSPTGNQTSATGATITTVVLTANATVSGSAVKLTFNATNSDGTNAKGANDPLDITTCHGDSPCTAAPNFGVQYCTSDYAIKLAPISYIVCSGPGSPSSCVDTSSTSPDIANPKLVRVQNGSLSVVMEQVIGFKVGAAIYNTSKVTTADEYQYNSACYNTSYDPTNPCAASDVAYNFTVVRSVRASIIARTTPNLNATYTYRNTFDAGPYQVQGMAVVVNPRNMSMND
jgi:hypothetical protein